MEGLNPRPPTTATLIETNVVTLFWGSVYPYRYICKYFEEKGYFFLVAIAAQAFYIYSRCMRISVKEKQNRNIHTYLQYKVSLFHLSCHSLTIFLAACFIDFSELDTLKRTFIAYWAFSYTFFILFKYFMICLLFPFLLHYLNFLYYIYILYICMHIYVYILT